MRVFKKYAPKQIANYVVAFFKGQFSIEGAGTFTFDCGRVIATVKMDEESVKICREINEFAGTMSHRIGDERYV
ncbi:MAG: DUF1107 family protein [Succinivibrio sp.]